MLLDIAVRTMRYAVGIHLVMKDAVIMVKHAVVQNIVVNRDTTALIHLAVIHVNRRAIELLWLHEYMIL